MAEKVSNTVLVVVLENTAPGATRYLSVGNATKVEDQETFVSILEDATYVRLAVIEPDNVKIVGYVADATGNGHIDKADEDAYIAAGKAALSFSGFRKPLFDIR